jgi:hypothetical protein
MSLISKTKIISFTAALFFAGAAALLFFHGAGPLKAPGMVAAVTAAVLAAGGYALGASLIGIATASISFLAQARYGFCPDCAVAASCFAAGGLMSGVDLYRRYPAASLFFTLCLIASMSIFTYSINKTDSSTIPVAPQTIGEITGRHAAPSPTVAPDRPPDAVELYFSPWCSHCGEAVAAYVQADPEGKKWRPVVVPEAALADGEKELRGLGYSGPVAAAPVSPSGGVPCVRLPDGRVVTGSGRVTQFIPKHDRS